MHKAVHGVLTFVMLFLAYTFLDQQPPVFMSNNSYDFMSQVMTEEQWALACGLNGTIGLLTLFVSEWRVRVISAAILGAGHLTIAVFVFLGNRHATGTGLFFGYGALGILLAYSTAHLGRRVSEDLDPSDLP